MDLIPFNLCFSFYAKRSIVYRHDTSVLIWSFLQKIVLGSGTGIETEQYLNVLAVPLFIQINVKYDLVRIMWQNLNNFFSGLRFKPRLISVFLNFLSEQLISEYT